MYSLNSQHQDQLFPFTSPDESLGFLLWQVSNLWQRKMKAGLGSLDLTHVQFVLLAGIVWLGQKEETITQVRLAAQVKTDVMMTSKVLRTLEKKGLIKREPHLTDTRAKSLVSTEEGYKVFLQAVEIVEQIDREFFQHLDRQSNNFNQCLQQILQAN